MTNLVTSTVEQLLPRKRKAGNTGWTSFNAVCCHHRGENRDQRGRGGIRFDNDGFAYHCFNCNFKAGWKPGQLLSKNAKSLLIWLNIADDQYTQVAFEVMRLKEQLPIPKKFQVQQLKFDTVELPAGTRPVTEALADNPTDDCLAVAEYLLSRRLDPTKYFWTSEEDGFSRRFIIPFGLEGRNVGWTARSIDKVKIAKYLSNQQANYVYGLDRQHVDQRWVFVTEGPLDADAINGCGLLHAELSSQQRQQIANLGPTPVLVPDRDKAGLLLAEHVLEHGWAVSFPEWHDDVKDVADANQRYGPVFTIASVIRAIETNTLKSRLKIRTLQKKLIDTLHD